MLEFTQNMRRQRQQGKFLWTHNKDQIVLEIFSPFGQTLARLEIHSGAASKVQSVLYMQGQVPRYAVQPEILLQQLLGFSLPIQAFTAWIDGQSAVTEPAQIIKDDQGRITSIQQMDWVIDYQPHATAIPRQIILHNTMRDSCASKHYPRALDSQVAQSEAHASVDQTVEPRLLNRSLGTTACIEVSAQDLRLRLLIDN